MRPRYIDIFRCEMFHSLCLQSVNILRRWQREREKESLRDSERERAREKEREGGASFGNTSP